jgi:hypothetical protein
MTNFIGLGGKFRNPINIIEAGFTCFSSCRGLDHLALHLQE